MNPPPADRQPIFNAPTLVIVLLGVLIAVHLARSLLADETAFRVVIALALIPGRDLVADDLPGGWIAVWTQFVTHMLIHGDATHLVVNGAWLLVFGTVLARRWSALRFLAFALATGIAGGLAFFVMHRSELQPMVGASGAISGLMGGALRLLFPAVDLGGSALLNRYARQVPRLTLEQALTDRRMLMAIAVIVGLNLLLATGFGNMLAGGGIAWEAHVGGFLAGVLAFGLFDDGPVLRRPESPPSDPGPPTDGPSN